MGLLRSAFDRCKNLLSPSPAPEPPYIPALPRGLPGVHSTLRVARGVWRNWSRSLEARPARIYCDHAGGPHRSPRTLEDLQAIVREARALKRSVRAFGSSHSWSPLVPTDGFLVDNRMIGAASGRYVTRVEPADPSAGRKARATVPPGVTARELERWLWESGYSLPAASVADCFSIAGMVATCTHGAGGHLPSVSDQVVGMTFVDGLGGVRRWTRESASPDELAAIQCGLGCLGLIYDITLEVEDRYELLFTATTAPYDSLFADTDEARARLRDLHERHWSAAVFWWPFRYTGTPYLSPRAINEEVSVITTSREIPAATRPRTATERWVHFTLLDVPTMMFNGYVLRALTSSARTVGYLPLPLSQTDLWIAAKGGSWRVPSYDAHHYVNATGVEFTLASACEWSIPFRHEAPPGATDGYERVRASFATLHDLVKEAFEGHHPADPRSSPANLGLELRTMAASGALLSPQYLPPGERAATRFSVPDLVTSAGQPAWEEFLAKAHRALTGDTARFGDDVRNHLAKEWRSLPHPRHPGGTPAFLRDRYREQGTWQRFLAVREAVDPDGVFLNDFLREWFELPRPAVD